MRRAPRRLVRYGFDATLSSTAARNGQRRTKAGGIPKKWVTTIQSPASLSESQNETGCFALFVADGGQPGAGPGDFFAIAFHDADEGVWYFNCGIVGGGNIVVKDGVIF